MVCLKNIPLFENLSSEELSQIGTLFHVKEYKKGESILKPEDNDQIILVKKGRVEFYQISGDGKKFITELIGPGSLVGRLSNKYQTERFIEAVDDCIVYSIEKEKFYNLLNKFPALSLKLIDQLDSRLMLNQQKLVSLATDDVNKRLIKLIISLGKAKKSSNQMITDKFTHEHLSQLLGISRQTTTIEINNLKKKGLIKVVKKRFIFNRSKLERLISK